MGASISHGSEHEKKSYSSLNDSNLIIATTTTEVQSLSFGTTTNSGQLGTTQTPSQIYNHDSAIYLSGTTDSSRRPISMKDSPAFGNPSKNGTSPDDFKINLFGTYVYPFTWLTLPTLYSWLGRLSSLAMIIGCVMPYVPQYMTIHKTRNCTGFSTFVCLTLLLANIFRIAFWFGHPFELPLLVQSVVMILAQILLLEICVRVKNCSTRRGLLTSSLRYFWRWTDLISYLEFLCLIAVTIGASMYVLIDFKPFVETIGYLALVTESMLGLPQVIKNYQKKSVEGMSLSMVIMWLGGDMFKTGYFITNNVPFQFWLCGSLQVTIDLLILSQVCIFRQNASVKNNSQAGESVEFQSSTVDANIHF